MPYMNCGQKTENFDRETILGQAEKYRVCPFEMTLDLAIWMDGIVCDYNYVFDPNVYLKRFFGENIKGNYIFLIDEAHNLVERGREMYSAAISKKEMEDVRKFVRPYSSRLYRMLGKAIRQMDAVQKECSLTGKVLEMQERCQSLFWVFRERWTNCWKNHRHRSSEMGFWIFIL